MKLLDFATLIAILAIRTAKPEEPTEDAVERILRRKGLQPLTVGMKKRSNKNVATRCPDVSF